MIGKQLVGKKAQYAGDDVKGDTRKFGVVYIKTLVDYPQFVDYFKKYGGTITNENAYDADGSTFGDTTVSESLAPTMVTRMKAAGVTTVIMLGDFSMNKALMDNATKQEWNPEWFFTGAVYADIGTWRASTRRSSRSTRSGSRSSRRSPSPIRRRRRPRCRCRPRSTRSTGTSASTSATQSGAIITPVLWLLAGIHTAGPNLTPKTFAQGLFSVPPAGGAAQNRVSSTPVRLRQGPRTCPTTSTRRTVSTSRRTGGTRTRPARRTARARSARVSAGSSNGAKRYVATTWPKKQFDWFDKDTSVYHFPTRQGPIPVYVGDCKEGCPSAGSGGQAGSPSRTTVVFKAYGAGQATE